MDKEDVLYKYNGILLCHNAICSNMDGSRDYHTNEVSQIKTNIMHHLYVESKK